MSKVFIHQTAIVDKGLNWAGTKIWHWVHVCAGASIGKDVSLGQNVFVGNRVAIGDDCKIQNNVSIYDNVTLEEGVFVAQVWFLQMFIILEALISRKSEFLDTHVGKGQHLGQIQLLFVV